MLPNGMNFLSKLGVRHALCSSSGRPECLSCAYSPDTRRSGTLRGQRTQLVARFNHSKHSSELECVYGGSNGDSNYDDESNDDDNDNGNGNSDGKMDDKKPRRLSKVITIF